MIEIKILVACDSLAKKARGLAPDKILNIVDNHKIQSLGFIINLAKNTIMTRRVIQKPEKNHILS
jgi:hypothetical protein